MRYGVGIVSDTTRRIQNYESWCRALYKSEVSSMLCPISFKLLILNPRALKNRSSQSNAMKQGKLTDSSLRVTWHCVACTPSCYSNVGEINEVTELQVFEQVFRECCLLVSVVNWAARAFRIVPVFLTQVTGSRCTSRQARVHGMQPALPLLVRR
jgi:hypothetical protein